MNSIIVAGTMLIMATACGKSATETEGALRDAEMALANGDMEMANSMANHISDSSSATSALTATQLARLSILYAQLADYRDEDTNTAIAVNYCRSALKENADSAEAYYSQLPPDQVGYARAILMIVHNLDNPSDVSDSFEPDSMSYMSDQTFSCDSTHL